MMESNVLFHEMIHALQAYHETTTTFGSALLNIEIEAHYAQYLYLKKLPEYNKTGNKWAKEFDFVPQLMAIKKLEAHVNEKGQLIGPVDFLNTYMEYTVANSFRKIDGYKNYSYNSNRYGTSNFSVLNQITLNCD